MILLDFSSLLLSTLTVVIAEMGDKTQLLAMAFAFRFKWYKVLIGVFIATVFNHALAVALGSFLGRIEATHMIVQIIASLSFILFGLWTFKGDHLGNEAKKPSRFGPIITVTIAFFIAEFGDKTQLATVALATKYPASPLSILTGTTIGMLIADTIGIVIGVILSKKIPDMIVRICSGIIFILFGLYSTFQLFIDEFAQPLPIAGMLILLLTFIAAGLGIYIIRLAQKELASQK